MKFLPRSRRWIALGLLAAAILAAGGMVLSDRLCRRAAQAHIFQSTAAVPYNDVALVLGTARRISGNRANLHFNERIAAAVRLYQSGKVRHLVVSGDNHSKTYDEPTDMRDALVAAGVPTNAITCDYAGFRTLDSVVRAQSVFGLTNFTIVTEAFHCPRAVWIARQRGLQAVAFAAPDPPSFRWTWRVKAREALARVRCGLDLYVLRTQPKFPGPAEPLVLAKSGM